MCGGPIFKIFFWLSLGGNRHHFTPKGHPPPHFQLFFFGWGRANFHFWGHTVFLRYFYFFSKNEAKNQQSLQLKWIYRYLGPSVPKIIFIGGIFDLALIWQKIAPLPLKLKNDIRVSGLWPHFLTKMVLTLQALLNMVKKKIFDVTPPLPPRGGGRGGDIKNRLVDHI